MCLELSDDCIDELAIGRLLATREQLHLDGCCDTRNMFADVANGSLCGLPASSSIRQVVDRD